MIFREHFIRRLAHEFHLLRNTWGESRSSRFLNYLR